jgi:hypothetical protein
VPSQSTPRGPRSHRAPTFPHGYVPYQPPPSAPPPMYVIHSPAQTQTTASGEGAHVQLPGQGQVLSPVYMPVQVVPGSFNPEVMGSPTSSPGTKPAVDQTP